MSENKITSILKNLKHFSYSYEVTPNVDWGKLEKLSANTNFVCVTWHARNYDFKSFDLAPVNLAKRLKDKGKTVCLHLTCDLLKKEFLNGLLKHLQEHGICNLFIILGESYDGKGTDFKTSQELIEHIRNQSDDYFCIGVAGFPNCPENVLTQLKTKIEAGVDFIITKGFFDSNSFKTFVERCVKMGIKVPIIPGIFYFESEKALTDIAKEYGIDIPKEVLTEIKKSTVEYQRKLISQIYNTQPKIKQIHFFTIDKLDSVTKFINELKL